MGAFGAEPPDRPLHAQELADDPDAAGWARVCAWVPGTGHCRIRDCSVACLFRPQREDEALRVQRWRRIRRVFARRI